jgi:hypothetical protein
MMDSTSGLARKRFIVRDAMILAAGLAISLWIDPENELPNSVWYAIEHVTQYPSWRVAIYRIAMLLSGPVQPMVAVWTLTVLILALSRRRGSQRQSANPAGFVACCSAALVILIVGLLDLVTLQLNLTPGLTLSVRTAAYLRRSLTFDHAECGIAVAACWLTLLLARQWRPGPDWIDRSGVALGFFWISMIPVTRLGPHLLRLM